MDNDMQTIDQFISERGIRLYYTKAKKNPNMIEHEYNMNHYKTRLYRTVDGKRRQLTVVFSMGIGIKHPPSAADVLDCLASDSSSVDNAVDLADWMGDLGYELPDLRKARKTWNACKAEARRLQRFLGATDYETLLYTVERL